MARKALTDRFIDSVKVERRENYFDEKAVGLCLRVTPGGVKSWSFVYRMPGGDPQWMALGTYPALKLEKARARAYTLRAQVENKVDPQAEEKGAAQMPAELVLTFGQFVAETYLPNAKANKRTWRQDELKLNKRILPAWADLPFTSITRKHVVALLDTIQTEVLAAKNKGTNRGANVNRYQALISRIFTMALNRSVIENHPVSRLERRVKEKPRERKLSDMEIRDLYLALDARMGTTPEGHAEALAIRMLTGQRGGEVVGMLRDEVDLKANTWEMPGARTKNGRAHVVPLSKTTKAIIDRRLAVIPKNEKRVFPDLDVRALSNIGWFALHGGTYNWRDLRRTTATRLSQLGHRLVIGRLLNHVHATVTDRHYDQYEALPEKRAALDAWDKEVRRIVSRARALKAA